MTDRELAFLLLGALQAIAPVLDYKSEKGVDEVLRLAYESHLFIADDEGTVLAPEPEGDTE